MRACTAALLALPVFLVVACGGSGGGQAAGPPTAPTPPPSAQPAGVNISNGTAPGGAMVTWGGTVTFDGATGADTITFDLRQSGATVTGQLSVFGPDGTGGPVTGTVSGNVFSFNFSVGNQGQGCGNTASGMATVGTSTMNGTFSGQNCRGQPITNGKFSVSFPAPIFHTAPYAVGGKWTANVPSVLGSGLWTFNISETVVDVNSSTVSGSVSTSGGNPPFGTGSLTGTVTNTFPGPTTIARMTVTFSGACASTLQFTEGFPAGNPAFDGTQMTGGATGSTCNGALAQTVGLNLFKQ